MGDKQARSSSRREMSKIIAASFLPPGAPEGGAEPATSPAPVAEAAPAAPEVVPPQEGSLNVPAAASNQADSPSSPAKAAVEAPGRRRVVPQAPAASSPARRGRGRPRLGSPEPEIGGKVAVNTYLPPELYLRMKSYVATPGAQEATITGLMTAAVRDYLDREEDLLLEQQRARERRLQRRSG